MKTIVLFGKNSIDGLEYHLEREFVVRGFKVVRLFLPVLIHDKLESLMLEYSSIYQGIVEKRVVQDIAKVNPDYFITTLRNIPPSIIKSVKNLGIFTININPDHLVNFYGQQIFAEPFDLYFTKDKFIHRFMTRMNALNTRLYNEAGSVKLLKDFDSVNMSDMMGSEILSFGNLYPYRQRFLSELQKRGHNIAVYGKLSRYRLGTDEVVPKGGPIYGVDKIHHIKSSKIVLNNLFYGEVDSVNNKFFEINIYGGFQLCDYRHVLHELLPVDPKLVSFDSIDTASERIDFFLTNPTKREELKLEIQNHFIENFTYKQLVSHILKEIG